jgi:hypothetical protein
MILGFKSLTERTAPLIGTLRPFGTGTKGQVNFFAETDTSMPD